MIHFVRACFIGSSKRQCGVVLSTIEEGGHVASKEQLEFFRNIYEREHARYVELINRGKLFLSIITLYFGAIALAAEKTLDVLNASRAALGAYLAGAAFLSIAMALVIGAIGIYKYAYPNDPKRIIESGDLKLLSEEEFREQRLFEYAVAADMDHKVNEKRSALLRYASFGLFGGIAAHSLIIGFIALG